MRHTLSDMHAVARGTPHAYTNALTRPLLAANDRRGARQHDDQIERVRIVQAAQLCIREHLDEAPVVRPQL